MIHEKNGMIHEKNGKRVPGMDPLDSVARVVGPILGGMLIGGILVPSTVVGGAVGAAVGAVAGLTRNRELAHSNSGNAE